VAANKGTLAEIDVTAGNAPPAVTKVAVPPCPRTGPAGVTSLSPAGFRLNRKGGEAAVPIDFTQAFTDADLKDAWLAGAKEWRNISREEAPKKSGALAESGRAEAVNSSLALVIFPKVYAAKQERRDDSWRRHRYHHSNGGPHFVRDGGELHVEQIMEAVAKSLRGNL
jgi:hypothetical protein